MKLKLAIQLFQNMGPRYVSYRVRHEVEKKIGVLKKRHPIKPIFKQFINLENWRKETPVFFFEGKNIPLTPLANESLKTRVESMKQGRFVFFSKMEYDLGVDYDWVTNPVTGYRYDVNEHWSTIADLSKKRGDIKFVWEKARFAFLTDLIRYDFHYKKDQSEFVFEQIMDFIEKNHINCGPNYKCSQEISLRTMNWIFALYYYKNSPNLTEERFDKIMHVIRWQLHHVYNNIDFSRIAVRNNHAITETLMLYLSGLLFPFIPETKKWSANGKKWFEQEVAYQIYDDGTFLQYSMNYHRVVLQLLTWGIRLSESHGDRFSESVYVKAQKSLDFLDACVDASTGLLPNYGSNDGALFFKLTNHDYRVYTSQVDDLRMALKGEASKASESFAWYGMEHPTYVVSKQSKISSFRTGGYYMINEDDVKTFLRCGAYKDRPAQADNLHLDIWAEGKNYIWDCGSYKYNTEDVYLKHFMGSTGHNTVTIGDHDQMLKGGRFIWYKWIKRVSAKLTETQDTYLFEGVIYAFRQIGSRKHKRTVAKTKNQLIWEVNDTIALKEEEKMKQHWHVNPALEHQIAFEAIDGEGNNLEPLRQMKWYSSYYGSKEASVHLTFATNTGKITTIIKINR